jgi:hypothetical protein
MTQFRAKMLGVLFAALAIGAFAVVPTIGSAAQSEITVQGEPAGTYAAQGCEANNVCGYTKAGFEGERYQYPCSASGNFEPLHNMNSARNRCGNKIDYLANGASKICLPPGNDRENPGTYAVIILPAQYGTVC